MPSVPNSAALEQVEQLQAMRAVFDRPNAFEAQRPDNPHLTFGHGAHYCIGAPLALIELQVVFGTLPCSTRRTMVA